MMLISSGRLKRTLVASFLLTLLALIAPSRFVGNSIHILSGLLFSWFIPGFALIIVLYPNEPILSIRIVILGIVTSFVLDILVGTLLDVLNLGLNELGFVIGLWLITVLLLIIGTFTYASSRISSSQTEINGIRQFKFRWRLISDFKFARSNYVAILLLASVLFVTVSWAFRVNLRAVNIVKPKTFTTLAIEPLNADVTNKNLRIAIDNREGKPMVYKLEMRRNSVLLMEWGNITLDQDEQWVVEIPLSQFASQSDLRLFKKGENEPYRQVHFVVP